MVDPIYTKDCVTSQKNIQCISGQIHASIPNIIWFSHMKPFPKAFLITGKIPEHLSSKQNIAPMSQHIKTHSIVSHCQRSNVRGKYLSAYIQYILFSYMKAANPGLRIFKMHGETNLILQILWGNFLLFS